MADTKSITEYQGRLVVARQMLTFELDPQNEEHIVAAGREIVAIGKAANVALGELFDVRADILGVREDFERINDLYLHYAREWGVSKAAVIRAHVVACKYHDIPRPEDASQTLVYEVLSGAVDAEDANIGFEIALANGWTVTDVRIAKALRRAGLTDGWESPTMAIDSDNYIWARGSDGAWHRVLQRYYDPNNGASEGMVSKVLVALQYRAGIQEKD